MPANAKSTKRERSDLPSLDDVESGRVSLDAYEVAHGEDIPELTAEDMARARPISEFPDLQAALQQARRQPRPAEPEVDVSAPVDVRFDEKTLHIDLADGRTLSVPLTWYPDLVAATAKERQSFELSPDSVRWPLFDEEADIASILRTQIKIEALRRARGQRGPQKAATKDRIGLRLDREVVEHFRATGPGWQSRINDVLVKHVRQQS
jgi:uncharacterized protein (DUF4415 family)